MSNDIDERIDGVGARPEPGDAELIAAVRGGDNAAFGELYQRHSAAAYGLARQLAASPSGVDDLVAEAFAKVLEALRAGRGPDSAFRAYLLTTLRHGLYDSSRRDRRLHFSDDLTAVDPGTPFVDTPLRDLEASLVARAFAALPERWQTVLWHTEIEGQKPAEVALLLGLTANGAAALAYRAREGLRQAYLQAHLADSCADDCQFTVERLGAFARQGLAKRERTKVQDHLDDCERCRLLAAELVDVNRGLRAVVAPLVLGAPFVAGYLTSLGAGSGAAGGAGLSAAAQPGVPVGSEARTAAVGTAAAAPGSGGASTGVASAAGAASAGRRAALLVGSGLAAAAVIAGVAYAAIRYDSSTPSAAAPVTSPVSPAASAAPAASGGSASTASPTATPTATALPTTAPPTAAPPSSGPTAAPAPAEPRATEPVPATTALTDGVNGTEPVVSPPVVLAPLSVAVSIVYNDQDLGQAGTLSGAVGPNPQVRLLTALPPGWSVRIVGPCAEGAATTVCTLPGTRDAVSLTVEFVAPPAPTDNPAVTIGLFGDASDSAPIDSF